MLASSIKNGISSETDLKQEYQSKPLKSWRILSFFKNTGLMIKLELAKQTVYLSFIDKTSMNTYQPFNEGFVVKLDLLTINELVYCLGFPEPVAWEGWREKNGLKYQLSVAPFKLETFQLTSKKTVEREAYALKLAIYANKETKKQFILSPYEYELVKDMLVAFRKRIVEQFSEGVPPENI